MRRFPYRPLLALAIGSLGGWLAWLAHLPLAWMIGAMIATTAAAMAGAPVRTPRRLRDAMVAVLGVMLGSSFSPALLDRLGEWSISLGVLALCILVSAGVGYYFFRQFCGYDRVTAYFAAMPGGLQEMTIIGTAMGGDERIIAMTQAARVMLVVLVLPFAFMLLLDYHPGGRGVAGRPLVEIPLLDLAILGACALAGRRLGQLLRIPASQIIGPMLLSAAVHLAGWTQASPPAELMAAAQVAIGTAIGCRFAGVGAAFLARTLAAATGLTLVLITLAVGCALAVHQATDLSTAHLVLAYAPGGLAEMSLVAVALALEPALVATHHIVRIFLVVVLAPAYFRLVLRRPGDPQPRDPQAKSLS